MKLGTVISYLKKIKKYLNHVPQPLSPANISFFSPEFSKFCFVEKYGYVLHFDTQFSILLNFLGSLKIVLITMVTISMMSGKMATPGLLKIKVIWNKGYKVIISIHDVTNKISARDSNYIVDVVMWPKFVKSSISMREVVITSIL